MDWIRGRQHQIQESIKKYEAIKRNAGRRKCGQVDHNLGKKSIELMEKNVETAPSRFKDISK